MTRIVLAFFLLSLPLASEAAYKIYLKNGSAISGVKSYEKQDGEILIHFEGGSIGVPKNDILKIQESEAPEKDFRFKGAPETTNEKTEQKGTALQEPAERGDISSLKAELDAITAELKTLGEDEARVRASIDEKRGKRRYTAYQLRQMEKEVEPLQEELFAIQQKKSALTQRKDQIEGDLRRAE